MDKTLGMGNTRTVGTASGMGHIVGTPGKNNSVGTSGMDSIVGTPGMDNTYSRNTRHGQYLFKGHQA